MRRPAPLAPPRASALAHLSFVVLLRAGGLGAAGAGPFFLFSGGGFPGGGASRGCPAGSRHLNAYPRRRCCLPPRYDTRKDIKFERDAPIIGLVLQRSHLVTGDAGHYDGVVSGAEGRGSRGGGGGLKLPPPGPSARLCRPPARRPSRPVLSPAELEARGAKVVPVFAGGLDFSLPVKKFFYDPLGSG